MKSIFFTWLLCLTISHPYLHASELSKSDDTTSTRVVTPIKHLMNNPPLRFVCCELQEETRAFTCTTPQGGLVPFDDITALQEHLNEYHAVEKRQTIGYSILCQHCSNRLTFAHLSLAVAHAKKCLPKQQ